MRFFIRPLAVLMCFTNSIHSMFFVVIRLLFRFVVLLCSAYFDVFQGTTVQMTKTIENNTYVVIQKVGGEHVRVMRLSPKQKVLIEKLKFVADSAIGKPYGLFEVIEGKVSSVSPEQLLERDGSGDIELRKEIKDVVAPLANSSGDVEGSEVDLVDTPALNPAQAGQKLTQDQVLDLKSQGISSDALVAKLVEGNKSFTTRTVYSQSKYIRRKTKKHSDRVLILMPTIRLIAQAYYFKDAERVGNLRIDQLGLILQMAGIHHGKNVIVFEQVLGLVTSGVLDRLGGHGACIHIHRGLIAQSIPCVHSMNYDDETLMPFLPVRITELLADPTESPSMCPDKAGLGSEDVKMDTESASEESQDGPDGEGESPLTRRVERLAREQRGLSILRNGVVDSLIIAARTVDPVSVLELIYPKLRPGAAVVVYGPNIGPIIAAQTWLMSHDCLNVQLSEQMYRIHQVLPDRTHPLMTQHVVGGYVLSGLRVLPAPIL